MRGRREKGGRAGERRDPPARPGGKRNQRFFKVRRAGSSKPAQRHFQETAGAAGSGPRTPAFPGRAAGSENWGGGAERRAGAGGAMPGGSGERGQRGPGAEGPGAGGAQAGPGSGETRGQMPQQKS